MGERTGDDDPLVAKTAAVIVGRLDEKLGETTAAIQESLVREIAELRGDPQLLQLMRDTVAANIDTFLSAVRHRIPVEHIEPPAAALEYARRLAQREVSANALVRAYRLGHQATQKVILDETRAAGLEQGLGLAVYDLVATISFQYIDRVSQVMIATYENEREQWVERRHSERALRVRDILSGGEVDVDTMTTAIRYPLNGVHLAAIAWCHGQATGSDHAGLERFIRGIAEALDAQHNPLFLSVDRQTAWAWIPVPVRVAPDAVSRVRSHPAATDGLRIAVGNPLPGIEGFRRSHQQARDAHTVATAAGAGLHRVTAASDSGLSLVALLGDLAATSTWVREVLGPLASATEGDDRLRETLRVFLGTGASNKATAEELHLHANTVKYRVARAVERRGRPIAADRLDVEVALLLCHWYGAAVLAPG